VNVSRNRVSLEELAARRGYGASLRQLFAVALFGVALPAFSHDGEDHGAPPPPVNQAVAPRAIATTEDFEVVAVLEGNKLVVYVDAFASNEPVANAKVEIDGTGMKGIAREVAPGTYALDLAEAPPRGKHGLTIGIEAGDTADLLSATLDTSMPDQGEVHVHDRSEWIIWIIAALLSLAAGVLVVARRVRSKARGL